MLSAALASPAGAGAKGAESDRARPEPDKRCDYRTPVLLHEVESGEHLGLIAGRYGVFRKDLIALNPELENPDLIRPGQLVRVCPEILPRSYEVIEHVVQKGENLKRIAERYELELAALLEMQAGGISDPNTIRVGQKLRIEVEGEILPGFEPRPPKRGRITRSVQLPEGPGYLLRRPHLAYGTAETVALLQKVLDRYRARQPGSPKVRIGDLSKRGGGPIKGHLSHREGVDVDIGLVHRGSASTHERFLKATTANLDVPRTWALVHEFLRTGEVRYIFLDYQIQAQLYEHALASGVPKRQLDAWFQYPRGRGRGHGIVRHWRNHDNHIHVRFRR